VKAERAPKLEPTFGTVPEPTAMAEKPAKPKPVAKARAAKKRVTKTAFEAATECVSRGDNRCVIRALAGKARTEQEYRMLIETYRAMGNPRAALRQMRRYVKKFPSGRRVGSYRMMLERSRR